MKVTIEISEHEKEQIERWVDGDADTSDKHSVEYFIYQIAEQLGIDTQKDLNVADDCYSKGR